MPHVLPGESGPPESPKHESPLFDGSVLPPNSHTVFVDSVPRSTFSVSRTRISLPYLPISLRV